MSENELPKPIDNRTFHEGRSNRWTRRAFIVFTMVLLISVITSNIFHLPTYAESTKSEVIVMAVMVFILSTVFGDTKSK